MREHSNFAHELSCQFEPSPRALHRRNVAMLLGSRWVLLGLAAVLFFVGCSLGTGKHESAPRADMYSGRLLITGSSTVAPLVSEIAKRFENLHPNVRIDVQTGGSGKGIADTRNRVADIGMASRPLKPDETDLRAHQIAADGVGIIVHADNPITQLDEAQIRAIYLDQIARWDQLGGKDDEIVVVHKAEGRATLEVFLEHFQLANPSISADVIVGDNEHAIKTVAGSKQAIGYVSIGTAEANIQGQVPIKLLPLAGVNAETKNVAKGVYPMSRPLHLVATQTPTPLATKFIQYCQSAEVHDLIQTQFFVPVMPEAAVAE